MRRAIKDLAIALILLTLCGCATDQLYRQPTDALYPTNRSTSNLFNDLTSKLHKYQYKVVSEDKSVGILLTAPRQFSFTSNGQRVLATQTAQIRQEGGAVKLRLSYKCNYSGDGTTFVPCLVNDQEAESKIGLVDHAFMNMVKPLLRRRLPAAVASKASDPLPKVSSKSKNPWASWGAAAQ